jgi:rhodanese-related sulfurtransferase
MSETNQKPQIICMDPKQAWEFMNDHPEAVLVDVRTAVEFSHVGHPVGALHIAWKEAPEWTVNPAFVDEVTRHVPGRTRPVLLLCRSGQRSLAAARALAEAGYSTPINIEEGFEGPLDEKKHRSTLGGWRFHGLPWEQG